MSYAKKSADELVIKVLFEGLWMKGRREDFGKNITRG